MNRLVPIVVALAGSALACSYDTSRLRGTGDAAGDGADVVNESAFDEDATPPVDAVDGIDDLAPDTVDTAPDAPVCSANPPLEATDVGVHFGPSLVLTGNTVGAPSVLNAATDAGGCMLNYAAHPGPERVYRYVVQQGPTLFATTDAPTCTGVFDTVLYMRSTCAPGPATELACDDDDMVLGDCLDGSGLASSATAIGLHPGDVVYVVVDGYGGAAGSFRLVLTENAVPNASPPSVSAPAANRCGCPDARASTVDSIPFPTTTDGITASTGTIQHAGDHLGGTHTFPFTHIAGVALEFQLASNQIGTGAGCANATATFDLSISGHVVQSFTLDPHTPVGSPVRVSYQTFAPIDLSATSATASLQLRAITTGCGGVQFDQNHAGTLTLLGGI